MTENEKKLLQEKHTLRQTKSHNGALEQRGTVTNMAKKLGGYFK